MRRILNITVCMMVCIVLISSLSPFEVIAEGDEYAEIVLKNANICKNASVTENFNVKFAKGRFGKSTDINSGNEFMYIDVDDSFLHNLHKYSPIDITVEYYDEGYGGFSVSYDSHNPDSYFGLGNNVWSVTAPVRLNNTKTWKTHTWHIEDMKFGGRGDNGCDLRIGVWDPYMEFTRTDVIFGGVKIEKSQLETPVKFYGIISSNSGNIFSIKDKILLEQRIENKINENISAAYTYRVYDENEMVCGEAVKEISLKAYEKKVINLQFQNPEKYGIYKIDVTENTSLDTVVSYKSEFSVAIDMSEIERNEKLGIVQQIACNDRSNAHSAARIMKKTGIGIIRDEIRWETVEYFKGEYKIPQQKMEKINTLSESGVDIMLVLCFWNPLYDNGLTPYTDEGIQAFANYAAFMANELKDKVKYFEVWNEYNAMPEFNNGYQPAETYAKMLNATYKAIKEVNKDAVVVGIGTGGVDIDFAARVFDNGGYDSLDAVSVHPYDWDGKYDETELKENITELKTLMQQYGELKPIYFTEIGYSSVDDNEALRQTWWCPDVYPYTEQEQAEKQILVDAYSRAYGLCDMSVQYCIYDRVDKNELEANFGIVKMWTNRSDVPSGAKKSYLSLSAYNYFVGNSEFKNITENGRAYAIEFYNKRLGKNVVLFASGDGEQKVELDLNSSQVELYDMYGNYVQTIGLTEESDSFLVNETPYYALYSEREEFNIDTKGEIVTVSGRTNRVGSEVTFIAVDEWSVEKDLIVADQKKADNDGKFAFSFKAESGKAYSVYIFDGQSYETEAVINNGYKMQVDYYADDVIVSDISQLNNAKKIKAVLNISDENMIKEKLKFFGAVYGGGELLNVDCTDIVWKDDNTAIVEVTTEKAVLAEKIKFMLWDKMLRPLNFAEEIYMKKIEGNKE